MQKGYVLYCADCGDSELEISYASGDDFPGEPLILCAHCPQCGNIGWIKGLSVAIQKIRAEQNITLMARAMDLKHLAIGAPAAPTDDEVEAWAKAVDGEHREMTAEDRRKTREFLEYWPEALVAEGIRDGRSESSAKRAKTKDKRKK